jgi:Flp pilus assembly protein TadD
LDPTAADGHASLGGLHLWYTRDWEAAEMEFAMAQELDPEHSYAHFWHSALLSALGRHDEAVSHAEVALALDPLAPPISSGLSRALFMKKDFQLAAREAQESLDLHPDYANLHSLLCSSFIGGGEYEEAEEACRRHQAVLGVAHSLNMGILRAYQGDREGALSEMEGAASNVSAEGGQPVIEAMVYAGLGDADGAMALLLQAEAGDFPHLEYLSTHPFFDKIRSDSRFQSLLRRLGF